MWDGLYPQETEQALTFRANNPQAATPKKASVWAQAGEIAAAPFKGVGQAGMQTARNLNAAVPLQVGNPLAMTATEQEDMLQDGNITRQGQDAALRQGVDALKPDPVSATTASMILQDGARLLTKVGMYSMAGGFPAAVAGTGADEGVTGYREMRDRGVDAATAAKVGAVRGVSTAVGVAIPGVGKTALQTVGLIAAGGPASFMTEQAVTRSILEQANYPELAREHDPTDLVGLGVSILVPGVVGTVLHRAKVKAAKQAQAPVEPAQAATKTIADDAAVLAADPDIRDAAHVSYRNQVVEAHNLGDRADPKARAAHAQAMEAAAKAMDEGQPVRVPDVITDPQRAQGVVDQVTERIRNAETEMAALRDPGPSLLASAEVPTIFRPVPRNSDQLSFELDPIMNEAQRLLGSGRLVGGVDELSASGAMVSPEVRNMMGGLQEFSHRMPELLQEISAVDWKHNGSKKSFDVIGEAVDRLRKDSPTFPADSAAGRAMKVARDMPDLPVRLDDDGSPPMAARDVLSNERDYRRMDANDATAYAAAVECFLRTGL